jgi:hypothetical protein
MRSNTQESFHVFSTMRQAWAAIHGNKASWWLIYLIAIGITIVLGLLSMLTSMLATSITHLPRDGSLAASIQFIFRVASYFITTPFMIGAVYLFVSRLRGKSLTPFQAVEASCHHWFKVTLLVITFTLLATFVAMLCLIPGILSSKDFIIGLANATTLPDFTPLLANTTALILLGLGAAVAIIIFFYGALCGTIAAVNLIDTNTTFRSAFRNGFLLTNPHAIRILGLLVVLSLAGLLLMGVPAVLAIGMGNKILAITMLLWCLLVAIWYFPFNYMCCALIYKKCKILRQL